MPGYEPNYAYSQAYQGGYQQQNWNGQQDKNYGMGKSQYQGGCCRLGRCCVILFRCNNYGAPPLSCLSTPSSLQALRRVTIIQEAGFVVQDLDVCIGMCVGQL
eukprot:TRINITY_DN5246_c0_g1_i2.p4 TRINITY_DN5246_c0_g1~~TRINITY_DN5246_c0_g1_i2.p4  ORF type:complete len:121 (-),score=7.56 TRINITY_DN5246_c0_g1_i2:330-638(-)